MALRKRERRALPFNYFPCKCSEIVDTTGICGYNVSVILDKYALVETQVVCAAGFIPVIERRNNHG